MTVQQGSAFAIVAAMAGLFAWDRLRYDLVAALALSAATLAGVVPAREAFAGFSNPVVIVIAAVMVIGRAIESAGIIEALVRRPLRTLQSPSLQVGALTASVTLLSAFMKNVGTLAVFIPIALRTAAQAGRSPSLYLMPMAFGSLVGGTITQIGTSPNLLISEVRRELSGAPFGMFDFTPVGLPLALVAIAFLAVGWRLIPRRDAVLAAVAAAEDYTSEVTLPSGSPLAGRTLRQLEAQGGGDITVIGLVRSDDRRSAPDPDPTFSSLPATCCCCRSTRWCCARCSIRSSWSWPASATCRNPKNGTKPWRRWKRWCWRNLRWSARRRPPSGCAGSMA